jgi:hypothetical protein
MKQDGLIVILGAALERLAHLGIELAEVVITAEEDHRLTPLITQTQKALCDANTAYLVLLATRDPADPGVVHAIASFEDVYEAIQSALELARSALSAGATEEP